MNQTELKKAVTESSGISRDTVERCFDRLLDVQREIGARGFIEATEHRFLVVARRGNA